MRFGHFKTHFKASFSTFGKNWNPRHGSPLNGYGLAPKRKFHVPIFITSVVAIGSAAFAHYQDHQGSNLKIALDLLNKPDRAMQMRGYEMSLAASTTWISQDHGFQIGIFDHLMAGLSSSDPKIRSICLLTLGKFAERAQYAHEIAKRNAISRICTLAVRNPRAQEGRLASDLLSCLARHEVTHQSLVYNLASLPPMVDTREEHLMKAAAEILCNIFANDEFRTKLARTEYVSLLRQLSNFTAENSATQKFAKMGIKLSQQAVSAPIRSSRKARALHEDSDSVAELKDKYKMDEWLKLASKFCVYSGAGLAWGIFRYGVARKALAGPFSPPLSFKQVLQKSIPTCAVLSTIGALTVATDLYSATLRKNLDFSFSRGVGGAQNMTPSSAFWRESSEVSRKLHAIVATKDMINMFMAFGAVLFGGVPFCILPYFVSDALSEARFVKESWTALMPAKKAGGISGVKRD